MRFEEAYGGWRSGRLTQEEAARLLGVCVRAFRRYIDRYEESGLERLIDRRLAQVSHRRAPVDEVMAVVERYRDRHAGWNVKHFHAWYKREGGGRSYTWVKNRLQEAGVVEKAPGRGKRCQRRSRAAWPGMMLLTGMAKMPTLMMKLAMPVASPPSPQPSPKGRGGYFSPGGRGGNRRYAYFTLS